MGNRFVYIYIVRKRERERDIRLVNVRHVVCISNLVASVAVSLIDSNGYSTLFVYIVCGPRFSRDADLVRLV